MPGPLHAEPGIGLPPLTFGPVTRRMLALFAGASGDHNAVHIDSDFAMESGLEDVFAQGMLMMGPLTRVVTDWAGLHRLESISVRFLAITPVGAVCRCEGQVEERFETDAGPRLRVALSSVIEGGAPNLSGEAIVRL
ncbi:MaoC/PaaZ C-terminal domain-containing protein [Pseudoruegeria sp. HB172150]|uniref:MaoC/PaaZ C-terminal domain-containing protein n=1 Tax=Pseudoruegeria sp. HB172150 TaxID=2721164 RepID=UPI001557EBDF|nr:MaoC/PaaZ C-terminal domain-containing protein [Pseudoruegeria sp. HB172150]